MKEDQLIQKTYGSYVHSTNVHRIMKLYGATDKINGVIIPDKWMALFIACQIATYKPMEKL